MSSLECVALKTSIRALAYKKPLLLSSCGSSISIWIENEKEFPTLVRTIPIALPQTITGIKFESERLCTSLFTSTSTTNIDNILVIKKNILIYSIQFIVFCQLNIDKQDGNIIHCELEQSYKANLSHWIIDIVFGNGLAYILNAKNQVLIYNLKSQELSAQIFGPQKCILYSGMFVDYSHKGLIIASGTVFRTVLLWAIEFDSQQNCWTLNNIQALEGHDGVIFSIDYNSQVNTLITASDDRSIRLWSRAGDLSNCQSQSISDSISFWKENLLSLAKIYYGHSARIWSVASSLQPLPIIISTGEDASICVWSLQPPYSVIQKTSLLKNNRLWCFAIMQNCVAFGGSDASIKFIDIDNLLSINRFKQVRNEFRVSLPKATRYLVTSSQSNSHQLLVPSVRGSFHAIDDKENPIQSLQLDEEGTLLDEKLEDIFNDYICLDTNLCRSQAVIASKFGHIGLIQPIGTNGQLKLSFIKKLFSSKIFDISFVDEHHFICCLPVGQVSLFSIESQSIQLKKDFILPVTGRHPWSSCGVLIRNALIVGDYSGSVVAFSTNHCDPLNEYRHIHGPNGVTSIKHRPHSKFVYSSGRNGKIIEYLIESDFSSDQINAIQHLRTFVLFSEMDWVSGFDFESTSPFAMKFVYGFEANCFLLWNLPENRIIFKEECGGGHRSYDFLLLNSQSSEIRFKFCFTKKDKLQIIDRSIATTMTNAGMYSYLPRKINSCAQLCSSSNVCYYLLGGEDTLVHIVRFNLKTGSLQPWTTLYGHISNISSIKCLESNNTEQKIIYAVSVGGRSQLIMWKFIIALDEDLICQERATNFLGMFDQHLLFEEQIRKANKDALPLVDIRYLHVDLCHSPNRNLLYILVACSDCAFRLFCYNDSERSIVCTEKVESGTSCLLMSRLLSFESCQLSSNMQPTLICALASTDGRLCLWSTSNESSEDSNNLVSNKPIFTSKLHQAGINAMDFRVIQNTLLILTGGDDNMLKATLLSIDKVDDATTLTVMATVEEAALHTCQITGLKFLSDYTFVSASIDQKIISWQLIFSSGLVEQNKPDESKNNRLSMSALDSRISSVADISSIELTLHNNYVLICGEGLELVKFPCPTKSSLVK